MNMKKLFLAAIALLCLTQGTNIKAECIETTHEQPISERRVVVRQVYKEYSYLGYKFVIEGTYTTQTDGTVISSSLTARAISSGCTVSSLEQRPSGNSVIVTLNVNTPAGGGCLIDTIQ